MNYTPERWNKLKQILELIANQQIDALTLRSYCDDLDEWNFITKRLTSLGVIYFKDLNVSENEKYNSEKIAKEDYEARNDMEGYYAEMELLHAPAQCVAGMLIKIPYLTAIDAIPTVLPQPDFYLGSGFVQNENGEPVLFVAN
jgi:hypothetical protein